MLTKSAQVTIFRPIEVADGHKAEIALSIGTTGGTCRYGLTGAFLIIPVLLLLFYWILVASI